MCTDAFSEAELSSFLPSRVGGACRTALVFFLVLPLEVVQTWTTLLPVQPRRFHPVKYNQSHNVVLTKKE